MIWRKHKQRTLWLVKDDPEGKWWCECPQGIVNAPHHDRALLPTGGTGWLFTCAKCHRAFMFARAAWISTSLRELAKRDTPRVRRVFDGTTGKMQKQVLLSAAEDWLAIAEPLAATLIPGHRYVYFDGHLLSAVHGPVKFKGLWREHDLPDLPHLVEATDADPDPPLGEALLHQAEYWSGEYTPKVGGGDPGQ